MQTKVKKKKLPLYKLVIDENDDKEGIECISLVTAPAIEVGWIAMSDETPKEIKFAVDNIEQQTILGPVLIPGLPIYRKDFTIDEEGNGEDAEVYFDAEDVESIVQKFFRQKYNDNVDLEHDNLKVDGAYLYQSFISDKANGINPKQFADLPDKTFYAKYKVTDPVLWSAIKEGIFTGFSLAGFFDSIQIKATNQKTEAELASELYEILLKLEQIAKK